MADEGFKRKLTAILRANVEGYSRLMGVDEKATVRTLKAYREVCFTLIQQHNGKVLDSQGDTSPNKDPADRKRLIGALRKAGLM